MSRTENAIKNTSANFILLFVNTLLGFASRVVFTKILGQDYLGVNSLLTNVVFMLSMAELGIGTAINYSLYKPLAEEDVPKIKVLMKFYKKAYYSIGTIVFLLGLILIFFLDKIVPNPGEVQNLVIIFLIYVFNASYSYFFTYKVTLLEASQKNYLISKINVVFAALIHIAQIIVLLLTRNYIVYLITSIGLTFIQRIIINRKIDKTFPYLQEECNKKLDKKEKQKITKNVKALVFHKIGDYCINGTDNILISIFDSIGAVGIYSNYSLLTSTINSFISGFFSSITSSFGNLIATENEKKREETFLKVNFIAFWLYGFSFICFFVLIDPFIELIFGEKYLLNFSIVFVALLNFYVTGMRVPVGIVKNSAGIYDQDKYVPLIQSAINLVVSIVLGAKYGLLGIFIGTLVSSLALPNWHRPYIVYKNVFKSSPFKYYLKTIVYFIIVLFSAIVTKYLLDLFCTGGILMFILRMFLCLILSNLLLLIFTFNTHEFKELIKMGKETSIWKKIKRLQS